MSLYENENENEDWLLQNDLYESAQEDIDYIINAILTPHTSVRNDNSNVFQLTSDSRYYVDYVKQKLEKEGIYVIHSYGNGIGVSLEKPPKKQSNRNCSR